MTTVLSIVIVLALVVGNAVFVAAEYALVTARRTRLEDAAAEGSRTARTAVKLMDEPVRFISTVQVAITVFGILLGAVGEPLISNLIAPPLSYGLAFAISFVVLTFLSVVLGELVPKAIALQKGTFLARMLSIPLNWLAIAVYPMVWLLEKSANAVARLFGVEPAPAGIMPHTREEIRMSVAAAEDQGEFHQAEEEMLYKVFDFAQKEVHDVMVPRPEVVAISVDLPPEEALASVIESPYTRYPAYRNSLDDIVGVLHVRDLFTALIDRGIREVEVEQLLRAAHFVPENKDLGALLADFRRTQQHMAVVVDEYGAMQGIVTLEDLVEEIVGEIEDEFDLPDESVERIDESTIRIDGTFPIDDFNEQFQQELPEEDFHTLAGFVFGRLGRAPEDGDEIVHPGLRFTVIRTEGTRIEKLQVEFLPKSEHDPGGGPEAD